MSRTPKIASDLASDSSRTGRIQATGPADLMESSIPERLIHTRNGVRQADQAAKLGVHLNTYSRWERGERSPDAHALALLALEGWNVHWIITGDGPERLEAAFQSQSQDMSPADLSMAIQLANEKIAASGLAPSPEQYGKFVLLLYQVLHDGLPDAEIHDFPG